MPTALIISCGAAKLPHRAPAAELYTGSLFRAARAYAVASGLPWRILSARHGLLTPDQEVEPYDYRLEGRDYPRSRFLPRGDLGRQIRRWVGDKHTTVLELHVGRPYVHWVSGAVFDTFYSAVELQTPLRGLSTGARLHWYRSRRTQPPPCQLPPGQGLGLGDLAGGAA